MPVELRLFDLIEMHPRLLWESIITATAAMLESSGAAPPYPFRLSVQGVPEADDQEMEWVLDSTGVSSDEITRIRRTYESSRLVELAAIAIAGLALHCAGGHEINDLAVRGSAADYLVDETRHCLEIAGRTRRRDLDLAWEKKRSGLEDLGEKGYYLCIAEFESFTGRLGYFE
jgi:hypothetical protein